MYERTDYYKAFTTIRRAYGIQLRCDKITQALMTEGTLTERQLHNKVGRMFSKSNLNALVRAGYVKKEIRKEEFIEKDFEFYDRSQYITTDLCEDGTYRVIYRGYYTETPHVYIIKDAQITNFKNRIEPITSIKGKRVIQVKRAYYSYVEPWTEI